MTTALRYRLFHIGRMPPPLQQLAATEGVLLSAEGISVKQTITNLRIPTATVGHGVKLLIGAAVLTTNRLQLSVGSKVILDTPPKGDAARGASLTLSADGIHLTIDVATLADGGSGTMQLHYRLKLDEAAQTAAPQPGARLSLTGDAQSLLDGWKRTRAA